jgi:hypothetical protein
VSAFPRHALGALALPAARDVSDARAGSGGAIAAADDAGTVVDARA